MKDELYDYIKEIDELINTKKISKKVKEEHLIRIGFYQHERLIHLLVTLFYALFTILFITLSTLSPLFYIIVLILVLFDLFYIVHYFRLENGVQYLYKQYYKM